MIKAQISRLVPITTPRPYPTRATVTRASWRKTRVAGLSGSWSSFSSASARYWWTSASAFLSHRKAGDIACIVLHNNIHCLRLSFGCGYDLLVSLVIMWLRDFCIFGRIKFKKISYMRHRLLHSSEQCLKAVAVSAYNNFAV